MTWKNILKESKEFDFNADIQDSVEWMVDEIHEKLEEIKLNVDKDTPKITLNKIIRELDSLIMLEP
tara:strand:+ start:38720 stop:38917 length:198 start_codon:yes stop_codon:yes gene_type:complete